MLEERQLDLDEKPLVVQLNWNKDDREGRFVLKNENDILPKVSQLTLGKLKQKNQKFPCNIWVASVSHTSHPELMFFHMKQTQHVLGRCFICSSPLSRYQKSQSNGPEKEKDGVIQNFKRTLSKKEKKKEKKREKEFARIPDGDEQALAREDG